MNAIQKFIEAEHKYLDLNEIDYKEYEQMVEPLRDVECVVRCKDCIYGDVPKVAYRKDDIYCAKYEVLHNRCFYCADGVRKEGDGTLEEDRGRDCSVRLPCCGSTLSR